MKIKAISTFGGNIHCLLLKNQILEPEIRNPNGALTSLMNNTLKMPKFLSIFSNV